MSAVLQSPSPTLRPMQEGDLVQVMEVELRAYPYPWTRGIFRDCLQSGHSCWVLELENRLCGYGVLSMGTGEAHILNLCVAPERQRCGLGELLLKRLLETAEQHHTDTVLLEVRPSNRPALELYRRNGFNEVGTRRGYYPSESGREDAIILARELLYPERTGVNR